MTRGRLERISLAGLLLAVAIPLGATATTAPSVRRSDQVVMRTSGLTLKPERLTAAGDAALIVDFHIRNATTTARRFVVGSFRSPLIPAGATRNYPAAFTLTRLEKLVCHAVPAHGAALSKTLTIARQ